MVLKNMADEGLGGAVASQLYVSGSDPLLPLPISPVRAVSAGDRPSAQRAGCARKGPSIRPL